jgi:hypothetical protein
MAPATRRSLRWRPRPRTSASGAVVDVTDCPGGG